MLLGTASQLDQLLERGSAPGQATTSRGGPSSFAGVTSLINLERNKRQQRGGEQQHTTFLDITSSRATETSERAISTCVVDGLVQPGAQLKRRLDDDPSAGPTSKRQQGPGNARREWSLPRRAPLDWSLKTAARFFSPQPLRCLAEAAGDGSGYTFARGVGGFAAGDGYLTGQERLEQALTHWQHPAAPLPPAALPALASTEAGAAFLSERRAAFREAFRSAFVALRHEQCDALYYVTQPGSRRRLAVLFRGAGVAGFPEAHALLTRSTAGLRALLRGREYGARYCMPLAPDVDAAERAGDKGLDAPGPVPDVDALDDTPRSLLLFRGGPALQGLFDLLFIEQQRLVGPGADVPLLLAPAPFHGAAITRLRPRLLPPSRTAGEGLTLHRAEVSDAGGAPLPPWVVERLQRQLVATQGALRSAYETHELCTAVNVPAPHGGECSGRDWAGSSRRRGAGCIDDEEHERSREVGEELGGGYVRQVDVHGSNTTTNISLRL